MVQTVPDVLARIVEHKRAEIAERSGRRAELEALTLNRRDFRDFHASLVARPPAVIAEAKKASPSKGVLKQDFDPVVIARQYEAGGAAAMSVLTDERFFHGSEEALRTARHACSMPILRKDFTIDEFCVLEAAAMGADAILLIAAILTVDEMRRFRESAERFGMAALVEVHDAEELDRAVDSGARILGVNNRDLRDFSVSLETSERLAARMPAGVVRVSESGIHDARDVRRLMAAGYDAFLVGEHLMLAPDPAAALEALRASPEVTVPR